MCVIQIGASLSCCYVDVDVWLTGEVVGCGEWPNQGPVDPNRHGKPAESACPFTLRFCVGPTWGAERGAEADAACSFDASRSRAEREKFSLYFALSCQRRGVEGGSTHVGRYAETACEPIARRGDDVINAAMDDGSYIMRGWRGISGSNWQRCGVVVVPL